MTSALFNKNGFTIEYAILKSGSHYHFAFPGFGREFQDFEIFTPILKQDHGLIGVNLFFHGKSILPMHYLDRGMPISDFEKVWKEFLQYLQIDQYGLIGYSMGGKVTLTLLEKYPADITSVLLLAPDGFFLNPLYLFASGTRFGRWLFQFINRHPSVLFRLADFLKFMRILPPKLHRFVYVHMDSKRKRDQVYQAWMTYRWFRPNQQTLINNLKSHSIKFNMVFGKYDSIIRPSLGKKFSAKLGEPQSFHELHIGHRMVQSATVSYIEKNNLL